MSIIKLEIDSDLEELVPTYLGNLQKNISKMEEALVQTDFETVQLLGHNMKGSGGGYGFDQITEIGDKIENAAIEKKQAEIQLHITTLKEYLSNVEISYI